MKKPSKTPPAAIAEKEGKSQTIEGASPTIDVMEASNSAMSIDREGEPNMNPPASGSSSDDGFGAGVWNNDKRVNALFSTNDTRNSWMSIVGIGWVKLANNIDSANAALNILAATAKLRNSPVNYNLDGGMVTEIYVW